MHSTRLFNGEYLECLADIKDESIDAIITEFPHGESPNQYRYDIPFESIWWHLNRVTRHNRPIVLFGRQPFTSALIMSNPERFRYCWIWERDNVSNFHAVKFQPLNNTEDIMVFSGGLSNVGNKSPIPYNPQGIIDADIDSLNARGSNLIGKHAKDIMKKLRRYRDEISSYALKTLVFNRDDNKQHPTQKPIALMEYLIRTYTNEGDTVLDFAMGSGSTGVACKRLGRHFIGIESDETYLKIASNRILLAG